MEIHSSECWIPLFPWTKCLVIRSRMPKAPAKFGRIAAGGPHEARQRDLSWRDEHWSPGSGKGPWIREA